MAEAFTIDTNVLVYAVDPRDPRRQQQAQDLIRAAATQNCTLIALVLGEFFHVAVRRIRIPPAVARTHVQTLMSLFRTAGYDASHVERASEEVVHGRTAFWDAVLLHAAADAGCTVCLSEDMKDGARLGSIVVRNPFGAKGLSAAAKRVLGL